MSFNLMTHSIEDAPLNGFNMHRHMLVILSHTDSAQVFLETIYARIQ